MWGDVQNGQVQYIRNNVLLLARKLAAQYQQHNKTMYKIFPVDIHLLSPKFEESKDGKER